MRASDRVEPLVVGDAVTGVKGGSQMVKEVRHHGKEHPLVRIPGHELGRDGDREVSLSAPASTVQKEPAFRSAAVLVCSGERLINTVDRSVECRKRAVDERVEIRQAAELVGAALFLGLELALAGKEAAKVGVTDGSINPQPPRVLTNGTLRRGGRG